MGYLIDQWIKRKIGLADCVILTREKLEEYQMAKLLETLNMCKKSSAFYRKHLQDIDIEEIKALKDLEKIPFTKMDDLRKSGEEMLCVRPAEISRIVTLETSGTTGNPKRVYYTEEDQELTVDYFNNGMRNLIDANDTVLILLPCSRPGSVGDLLKTGIERVGAKAVPYGLLKQDYNDIPEVLNLILKTGVTSVVGSPTQVNQLAKASPSFQIRSVLLSTEYVPDTVCKLISEAWNCKVFEHYGMTEMGLGGAVSCSALEGYHPREADLYFEIIDPKTGAIMPDGEYGEVVFTTLTRKGMPLIRYRTGDTSRWLTESCPCGSILRRLDKVGNRPETKAFLMI